MDRHTATSGGLVATVVEVARNGAGLLLSRLELAALEFSEVRNELLKLLLLSALALVAGCFAIGCSTALIVYLSWDSLGWKILGLLAAVYTACAVALLLWIRQMVADGRLSMPSTMKELRTDRDAMSGLA